VEAKASTIVAQCLLQFSLDQITKSTGHHTTSVQIHDMHQQGINMNVNNPHTSHVMLYCCCGQTPASQYETE